LFFIGGCDIDCGKGPTTKWEINEISITNETFDDEKWNVDIEEATFEDLRVFLHFELKQVASLNIRMNRLYALDCSDPTIMLNSISSIKLNTVFDINDKYPAGANINEIITIDGYDLNTISQIGSYSDYDFYSNSGIELKFEQSVLTGNQLSLDMTIILSDGNILNTISSPVLIK
jgi:hypothetical protein